jgi:hypothetical protein
MYEMPVLFPPISNRETWLQTVQIVDDETGDLILLTDGSGNPLYAVYCEISRPKHGDSYGYPYGYSASWYDECGEPIIYASLADYITLPDIGTIQIQIPYTVMQTLRGRRTYNVYLRLEDVANADARQILIGKLPISYGGLGP